MAPSQEEAVPSAPRTPVRPGIPLNPPAPLQRLLAAATALLLAACGAGDASAPAAGDDSLQQLEGTRLVTGSAPREWGLLAVPRDGGSAQIRSVEDPSRVVWTGQTVLPRTDEIHLLDGPVLVLRTPGGAVHRYDPRAEELERVGEVGDDARWSGGGSRGVWVDRGASGLLEIGPDGAWRYELAGRPAWAAPAGDGSMAVLVEGEEGPRDLWLVQRGESEPRSRADRPYALPALVTAWGKRLAAGDPAGESLRIVALPSLTPTSDVSLPGPPSAVAASPSSHEIYVAVGSPPRVVRVSRFTAEAEVMASVDQQLREIRPATLGSFLLAHGSGGAVWIPLEGGASRELPGDWRADLPLGMPDGRVLLAGDEGPRVWDPDGGEAGPVSAPEGLWWGAVHWNPAPPTVVSGPAGGEDEAPPPGPVAAADSPSAAPAGEVGAGQAAPPDPAPGDSLAEAGGVPPGYYAVVTAAREAAGVRRLLDRLAEAGYPTSVQRHRDDAGQLWYRGMVGGYPSRAEAEAAARQLRRERDLDVWITEVRAGTSAEEIFR